MSIANNCHHCNQKYQYKLHVTLAYLLYHGTLNIVAIKSFGRGQHCSQACSSQCDVMTTLWKFFLWLGHHIVHVISHKSLHKYHSLCISSFASVGKFCFLSLFVIIVKDVEPWICCIFHGNCKVQRACKASTHLRFVFCLVSSKVLVVCQFLSSGGRVGLLQAIFALLF